MKKLSNFLLASLLSTSAFAIGNMDADVRPPAVPVHRVNEGPDLFAENTTPEERLAMLRERFNAHVLVLEEEMNELQCNNMTLMRQNANIIAANTALSEENALLKAQLAELSGQLKNRTAPSK